MNQNLETFLQQPNCAVINNHLEAQDHTGQADVIAYTGKDQDEFRAVVEAYRPPPVSTAKHYWEVDLGSDIVVYAIYTDLVDRVAAFSSPGVGTTNPVSDDPDPVDDDSDDDSLGDEDTTPPTTSKFGW